MARWTKYAKKGTAKKETSTAGWTPELREKIIQAVAASDGDLLPIAVENGVSLIQIYKCVARERNISIFRRTSQTRRDFLADAEQKVRDGYILGLQRMKEDLLSKEDADTIRITAEFRKGLEGTKVFQGQQPVSQTQNNFFGDVNIQELSDEQLAEHADRLARQLRKLPASTGPTPGALAGAEETEGKPDTYDVPGEGTAAEGTVLEVHGLLQSGSDAPGEADPGCSPHR